MAAPALAWNEEEQDRRSRFQSGRAQSAREAAETDDLPDNVIDLQRERERRQNELRVFVWRGIRVGLPSLSTAIGGLDFGLFSFTGTFITFWQFLMGFRYRNREEPVTITTIWTPPPLELFAKDTGNILKRLLFWFVDVLGLVWSQMSWVFVLIIATFMMIVIVFAYYIFADPIAGAAIPEVRQAASEFGVTLGDVLNTQ